MQVDWEKEGAEATCRRQRNKGQNCDWFYFCLSVFMLNCPETCSDAVLSRSLLRRKLVNFNFSLDSAQEHHPLSLDPQSGIKNSHKPFKNLQCEERVQVNVITD